MAKKHHNKRSQKARAKTARKKAKRQAYLAERVRRDPDYLAAMPYSRYLATKHWEKKRELVLERDGHACQNCHAHAGEPAAGPRGRVKLHVHHLTYERRGHELLTDLVTLCSRCHEMVHADDQPGASDNIDILHRRRVDG